MVAEFFQVRRPFVVSVLIFFDFAIFRRCLNLLTVLRREEKYPLTMQETINFANRFSILMMTDKYSRHGSYLVRSLYFDTIDDKDFFDKLNEQNLRRKVRLRIYDPSDQTAKLELKQKENIYQKKRSLSISRADAQALIDGNFSVLLNYPDDFAAEMFAIMTQEGYRPKSIVSYQRKAFKAKENNIRITFDSNIQATESCFDLFSPNLPQYSILSPEKTILEVKYDRFMLSYISEIISQIDRRSISSSKYCLSRQLGYPLRY